MNNVILSTKNIDDVVNDIANEVVKKISNFYPNLLQESVKYHEQWLNLDEVINYDPVKRTKPTWYSMVSLRQVPFHKSGGRLMFLKSEIDEWLKSGKHKTRDEIKAEVHTYLVNKKRKGQ